MLWGIPSRLLLELLLRLLKARWLGGCAFGSFAFTASSGVDIKLKGEGLPMTSTARKFLLGAALTGFVVGTTVFATAAPQPGDNSTTKTKVVKHCCAGKNSCKNQGGCGAEKGKNSCAGKGGCSTKTSCKGKPCKD